MSEENIVLSNKQNVLIIEINRPQKKNAISSAMYQQMAEALTAAATDDSVNVVLFQGTEDCFTAGNDLADFLAIEGELDSSVPVVQFLYAVAEFPKPMIAAVAGVAVGIGSTLLLHCDLVYADSNSRFSLPFVHLGLCAEAASSLLLPMQVGYHKAAEWLLLGEQFSAQEALSAGLINQIADTDVRLLALTKASHLASLPVNAVQTTRKLLKQSSTKAVKHTLQQELTEFSRLLKSDELKKIVASFLK